MNLVCRCHFLKLIHNHHDHQCLVTIFLCKNTQYLRGLNNSVLNTLFHKYQNNQNRLCTTHFCKKNCNKDYLFYCVCDNILSACNTSIVYYFLQSINIDYVCFVVVRCIYIARYCSMSHTPYFCYQ